MCRKWRRCGCVFFTVLEILLYYSFHVHFKITWYKDSEPVKVGNGHRLLLPGGSLFLLKVNSGGTDSDAGTYFCIAKNELGQVRSQEANLRIAMLRDDFRVNPHAIQTLIGNRAVLECSPPKGFPEPVVTWRRDEKVLSSHEDEKYRQHPNGNLIIENIQRSDAGFYQCIAGNMVGERVSKPARLSVYEKPKFLVITFPKLTLFQIENTKRNVRIHMVDMNLHYIFSYNHR